MDQDGSVARSRNGLNEAQRSTFDALTKDDRPHALVKVYSEYVLERHGPVYLVREDNAYELKDDGSTKEVDEWVYTADERRHLLDTFQSKDGPKYTASGTIEQV